MIMQNILATSSFEENYQKGLSFYLNNFLSRKMQAHNNQTFPVDIHAPAH
jgi:hypothetical protein